MGLRINNNITALIAHRNLETTSFQLQKSIERLSSGLRINRASDDPANFITSEQMRTQIAGVGQAISNTVDSISLIQTAEGTFDEVETLIRSIRTLALHAANTGPNDTTAIANDQVQIQNAISSLDNIATTRKYGSKVLLDGGLGIQTQMGASVGSLSNRNGINFTFMREDADATKTLDFKTSGNAGTLLGSVKFQISAGSTGMPGLYVMQALSTFADNSAAGAPTLDGNETLTINAVQIKLTSGQNIIGVKNAINSVAAQTGASALIVRTTNNGPTSGATLALNTTATAGLTGLAAGTNLALRLYSRVAGRSQTITVSTDRDNAVGRTTGFGGNATVLSRGQDTVARLLVKYGRNNLGVMASATLIIPMIGVGNTAYATDQNFVVNVFRRGNVNVNFKGLMVNLDGPAINTLKASQNAATVQATVTALTMGAMSSYTYNLVINGAPLNFQLGANRGESVTQLLNTARPKSLGLSGRLDAVDVRSALGAQNALTVVDEALNQVLGERGRIGSFQKQFLESTKENLAVYKENYQAAESNIRDTDVASEMISFTRTQILMQSGTAMLAQANLSPQSVLQLLR